MDGMQQAGKFQQYQDIINLKKQKTQAEAEKAKAQAQARMRYEQMTGGGKTPSAMDAYKAGIPLDVYKQQYGAPEARKMYKGADGYNYWADSPQERVNPSIAKAQTPNAQPSNVKEWEYYNRLSPEDQKRFLVMKRAQQIKDFGGYYGQVNPDNTVANIGDKTLAPTQKTGYISDAESAKVTGKAEGEKIVNQPLANAKLKQVMAGADNVVSTVDDALSTVDWGSTGVAGKFASRIPGTDAYDMSKAIVTIKSNLGFDKLQAMRDASPTGGALGQVSERELEGLQSTVASLDMGQSPAQLRKNLEKIKKHYAAWVDTTKAQHEAVYSEDELPASSDINDLVTQNLQEPILLSLLW
jgi:hypothetical protein